MLFFPTGYSANISVVEFLKAMEPEQNGHGHMLGSMYEKALKSDDEDRHTIFLVYLILAYRTFSIPEFIIQDF